MNYTACRWTLPMFGAVLVFTGFGVATGRMRARGLPALRPGRS
jgi:hypothetical protein